PVDLLQMPLDLAGGHSPGVERDDLVVEAVEPGLSLLDELRIELAVAVPRDLDRDLSLLALECLARFAVAGIAGVFSLGRVLLVGEMMGQLSLQDSFNQGFGELLEEAALAEQVLRFLVVLQKFVEEFFRDGHNQSFPRKLVRALWPFTRFF